MQEEQFNDPLARFIDENRESFDSEHPGLGVWSRIEQTLPTAERKRSARTMTVSVWRVAAAVVLLLVAGGIAGSQFGGPTLEEQRMAALQEVAPEFPEAQAFYEREIATKYGQLTQLDGAAQDKVKADLAEIDQAMQELRTELLEAPQEDRAAIVQNLIDTYQLKIEILERILTRISTDDETDNESSDETTKNNRTI